MLNHSDIMSTVDSFSRAAAKPPCILAAIIRKFGINISMRLVFSSIRLYRRIRSMHSSASFTKPGAAVGNCGSGDMENSCSSGTRGPPSVLQITSCTSAMPSA